MNKKNTKKYLSISALFIGLFIIFTFSQSVSATIQNSDDIQPTDTNSSQNITTSNISSNDDITPIPKDNIGTVIISSIKVSEDDIPPNTDTSQSNSSSANSNGADDGLVNNNTNSTSTTTRNFSNGADDGVVNNNTPGTSTNTSNVTNGNDDLGTPNTIVTSIADNNDISVSAPTSAGIAVTYTLPVATDSNGNPLTVTCTPASGSIFPIGDTTVTCTAVDSSSVTVSSTFVVTVTQNANPSSYVSGGGVGGGGSSSSGSGGFSKILALVGNGSGITTIPSDLYSCPLLTSYLSTTYSNDPNQVFKLQAFLKYTEGYSYVELTGIFDQNTLTAVKEFQKKYLTEVMGPWNSSFPSGIVYITTRNKINSLSCESPFTINSTEQAIIDAYNLAKSQGTSTDNNGVNGPSIEGLNGSSTDIIGDSGNGNNNNSNTASVGNLSILQRIWNFIKSLFGR